MKYIYLIFCFVYLSFSIANAEVIEEDPFAKVIDRINGTFAKVKDRINARIKEFDSVNDVKQESKFFGEMLIVLKRRAAGNNYTESSNPTKLAIAQAIDKVINTREYANFVAAGLHFYAAEMVSKGGIYETFYHDLTLSRDPVETSVSSFEFNDDALVKINNFLELIDVKNITTTIKTFIQNEKLNSIDAAKESSTEFRNLMKVMEQRASGDFSKSFSENSGGVLNTLYRHVFASMVDHLLTTRERANVMVAAGRLMTAEVVSQYPPNIGLFFKDMTLTYKDVSLVVTWN